MWNVCHNHREVYNVNSDLISNFSERAPGGPTKSVPVTVRKLTSLNALVCIHHKACST